MIGVAQSAVSKNNIEGLEQLYGEQEVQFVIACNKIYRRNLFSDLRFEEGKIHEDEFLAHKILHKSKSIIYIPIKLYYYYQRKNSITKSIFNDTKLDAIFACKDRVEYFRKINLVELRVKAEFNYINKFFLYYFKANELKPKPQEKLHLLKIDFIRSLNTLLKNPRYNWKEKLVWILFTISPRLYKLYVFNKLN